MRPFCCLLKTLLKTQGVRLVPRGVSRGRITAASFCSVSARGLVLALGDAAMLQAVQGEPLRLGDHADTHRFGDEALPGAVQRGLADRVARSLDQQALPKNSRTLQWRLLSTSAGVRAALRIQALLTAPRDLWWPLRPAA